MVATISVASSENSCQVCSLQSGVHWHKGTGLGVQQTSHFYTGGKNE